MNFFAEILMLNVSPFVLIDCKTPNNFKKFNKLEGFVLFTGFLKNDGHFRHSEAVVDVVSV